jgi:hypothetical protein
MFGAKAQALTTATRQTGQRRRERRHELQALRARHRGPAQALSEQRTRRPPTDPGGFCAALLGSIEYALPAEVDAATWRVALQHFAQRRPSEDEFRHLLERRAQAGRGGERDAGARVAAFLLREWERYSLARLLGVASAGGRRQWRRMAGRRAAEAGLPQAVQLVLRGRRAAGPSTEAGASSGRD